MKKQGKKRTGAIVALSICTLLFLVLAFVMFVADMDYLIGRETTDLSDLAYLERPEKDDHVTADNYAVLGKYAQTKHYINGFIPSGTEYHYILWLDNDAAISVTVKNKKMIEKLDNLETLTWEVLNGESTDYPNVPELEGKVSTMDPEIEGYYDDYLEEIGFTDSGFDIYYVTIDTTETWLVSWLYVLVFAVLAIICIISIIANVRQAKKEKLAMAQLDSAAGGQTGNAQGYNPAGTSQNNDIYPQS